MRRTRKDPRRIQLRDFRCMQCGGIAPAAKINGNTLAGHIKHMWCHWCAETTLHIQIGGHDDYSVEYADCMEISPLVTEALA